MRKAEFYVAAELLPEFALEMTDRGIENSITGVTEDDEIIIEVSYDKQDSEQVDELEELLDSLVEQSQKEDE